VPVGWCMRRSAAISIQRQGSLNTEKVVTQTYDLFVT
jgi:hypothetical protein